VPLPAPTPRPGRQRLASSPRRSALFLNPNRPVSFSTTYSKVHPSTTGVAVLEVEHGRGELEETKWWGRWGRLWGPPGRGGDVAGSAASPETRSTRALSGPISSSGRISRSSSYTHTYSNDHGVPPVITASFPGPFSLGGFQTYYRRWWKKHLLRMRPRWAMRIWRRCRSRCHIWTLRYRSVRDG